MKQLTLLLFAVLISTIGCKAPKELEVETIEAVAKGVIVADWSTYGGSDAIGINNVTVTGNKMSISVKYNGGCQKHVFQLIGHKMISKSLPPQRSIKLYHDDNNDDCRELIEEILIFDISEFAIGDGEVSLHLESYDEPISYFPIK